VFARCSMYLRKGSPAAGETNSRGAPPDSKDHGMTSHQSEEVKDNKATPPPPASTPPEDMHTATLEDVELQSVADSSESILHGVYQPWSIRKKALVLGSVSTFTIMVIVGLLFMFHFSLEAGSGDGFLPLPGSDVKSKTHVSAEERVNINATEYFANLDAKAFSALTTEYNDTEDDTANFVIATFNPDGSLEQYIVEEPISTYREEIKNEIDSLTSASENPAAGLQNFWTDGINDPIKITRTTTYPARVYGQFIAQGSHVCTGALIGNRVVLTNAHCVFDIDTRKWFNARFQFCPARNGRLNDPYGCFDAQFIVVSGNYANGDWEDDWALMILRRPASIGYLGFTTSFTNGQLGRLWHYSCEAPYVRAEDCGRMWYGQASVFNINGARAGYTMDTVGGSSGGSVENTRHQVFVVNAWSNRAGTGAGNRIRSSEFTSMAKYRKEYG